MKRTGNMMIEYTALIVLVIAALLGAQVYIRRAICGRWRKSADVYGGGRQYEPNVTTIE